MNRSFSSATKKLHCSSEEAKASIVMRHSETLCRWLEIWPLSWNPPAPLSPQDA